MFEPLVDTVDSNQICTTSQCIWEADLLTVTKQVCVRGRGRDRDRDRGTEAQKDRGTEGQKVRRECLW